MRALISGRATFPHGGPRGAGRAVLDLDGQLVAVTVRDVRMPALRRSRVCSLALPLTERIEELLSFVGGQ
jgi:hypothetical protein